MTHHVNLARMIDQVPAEAWRACDVYQLGSGSVSGHWSDRAALADYYEQVAEDVVPQAITHVRQAIVQLYQKHVNERCLGHGRIEIKEDLREGTLYGGRITLLLGLVQMGVWHTWGATKDHLKCSRPVDL
jgi:hypothetical protein